MTALSADLKALTTEQTVGTITLPSNATKIYGVGISINWVATTVVPLSGIFRIAVNNKDVTPARFVFTNATMITSGGESHEPRIYDVDWTGIGNGTVTFYITLDIAQTGVTYFRGFVLFEKT